MMEFAVFFFFAAIAVLFALVVILHRNAVVGALSLVASFFALAVMYVLLDAPFLAALQVIVYAGAIMVLFLFVIMLLNLQHEPSGNTRPVQQFLGYFTTAAFALTLVYYISKYAVFTLSPVRFTTACFRSFIAHGRSIVSTYRPNEATSIIWRRASDACGGSGRQDCRSDSVFATRRCSSSPDSSAPRNVRRSRSSDS